MTSHRRSGAAVLSAGLAVALLAGCSSTESEDTPTVPETPTPAEPAEVGAAQPRLAVTYDGGILVVDATSLDVIEDLPLNGFNRLSPAGDGRHVFVSTSGGFRALDTGSWSEPHGDHAHHYAGAPSWTTAEYTAEKPGHVVHHADRTALFDDGTGRITVFDPADLADGTPAADTVALPDAHHGVAVPLPGGGLLVTLGNSDSRNGIAVLDAAGTELTRNEQCPGVHGEATARDAIVVGCQDGMLVYRGDTITKVAAPDPYGRLGNQAGSEDSDIVLGDYKTDPEAELERPERVALVNTVTSDLRLVDLGTSYTFRSLGRGPEGEALVLGTDGNLHVIDEHTGEVTRKIAVVDPWTEPDEWQQPRPALKVVGGTAFVTEPDGNELHAVDLATGAITTATLPQTPNELSGT
ncbi:MAG: zinc metallochaperone AztD [Rhodococcus sp. (in: high G+C Gram-positive bacteria)]|uniref:zinc metallochaperone AztD n=1 Tax=Rhodococcus sp. TaxID=1831 RepID=UPI003BB7BF72